MIEFIHDFTEDGLELQAVHWNGNNKKVCVVCIHGMSGNIIKNYFVHVIGEKLSENKIGFLFGHTRGHSHLNDIAMKNGDYKRMGVAYELFEESIFDIDLWVRKAKELGYETIILMGHSLGCNKSIYYLYNSYINKMFKVKGLILASPPDMCGLFRMSIYQPNYLEMFQEAKDNMDKGRPLQMLSSTLWDWYNISSQTFLSLSEENGNVDNLPLFRNPDKYEQLSKIDIPILAFEGSNDDIVIRSVEEDLSLIKSKAIICPKFTVSIIDNSGHAYVGKENKIAEMILDWIKSTFDPKCD